MDVADDEVAPEKYDQAARSEQWRDSMQAERAALKNRGCWRVVRTPEGVNSSDGGIPKPVHDISHDLVECPLLGEAQTRVVIADTPWYLRVELLLDGECVEGNIIVALSAELKVFGCTK